MTNQTVREQEVQSNMIMLYYVRGVCTKRSAIKDSLVYFIISDKNEETYLYFIHKKEDRCWWYWVNAIAVGTVEEVRPFWV
jgi:hypothetical protein